MKHLQSIWQYCEVASCLTGWWHAFRYRSKRVRRRCKWHFWKRRPHYTYLCLSASMAVCLSVPVRLYNDDTNAPPLQHMPYWFQQTSWLCLTKCNSMCSIHINVCSMHTFSIQLTHKHVHDFEFYLNLNIHKYVQKIKYNLQSLYPKRSFS